MLVICFCTSVDKRVLSLRLGGGGGAFRLPSVLLPPLTIALPAEAERLWLAAGETCWPDESTAWTDDCGGLVPGLGPLGRRDNSFR